jgi:hypothetical protein
MIPTAREFLESKHIEGSEKRCKAMIEFAKLHCTKQARVISELDFEDLPEIELANDFEENRSLNIRNAYSLDLIK